jgi:hypothetical protein
MDDWAVFAAALIPKYAVVKVPTAVKALESMETTEVDPASNPVNARVFSVASLTDGAAWPAPGVFGGGLGPGCGGVVCSLIGVLPRTMPG